MNNCIPESCCFFTFEISSSLSCNHPTNDGYYLARHHISIPQDLLKTSAVSELQRSGVDTTPETCANGRNGTAALINQSVLWCIRRPGNRIHCRKHTRHTPLMDTRQHHHSYPLRLCCHSLAVTWNDARGCTCTVKFSTRNPKSCQNVRPTFVRAARYQILYNQHLI